MPENKNFTVEVHGRVRERYAVVAATAEEAMENWASGSLVLSEAWDCSPVSAEED